MKVEFKCNCEIQGKKFGFVKHKQTGTHAVPAAFVFDWFFVALVLEKHAKILEAHFEEFAEFGEEKLLTIDENLAEILGAHFEKETVERAIEGQKLLDEQNEKGESDGENSEDDSNSDSASSVDDEDSSDLLPEESEGEIDSEMDEDDSEEVATEQSEVKASKKKQKKKGKR